MIIPKNAVVPDPPGYSAGAAGSSKKGKKTAVAVTQNDRALEKSKVIQANELKMKKAWELAMSPAKSLPMQAIMLYMSGSGVQMFSMGIVWSLLSSPWKAVFGVKKAFEPFKQSVETSPSSSSTAVTPSPPQFTVDVFIPMLVFCLCQCAVLGLGIYKCSTMGLVPMGTGDWLQFETRGEPPEWSAARLNALG